MLMSPGGNPWSLALGPPSPRGIVGTLVGKLELILVAREEGGGEHSLLGPKSLSISYPHTILPMLHSLNALKSLFRGGPLRLISEGVSVSAPLIFEIFLKTMRRKFL